VRNIHVFVSINSDMRRKMIRIVKDKSTSVWIATCRGHTKNVLIIANFEDMLSEQTQFVYSVLLAILTIGCVYSTI
jgi:hypothetical protein